MAVSLRVYTIVAILSFANANFAVAQESHPGPFTLQVRTANPFREAIKIASRPTPVTIDFDKDGDIDVMVAGFDGGNGFRLLRNDGTKEKPSFNYALYWDNPFSFIAFDDGATPSFSDIDKDGDNDMLLGILDGTFRFYKNNPEATYKYSIENGVWNPVAKSGNPFHETDLGEYASPAFIDMDNDGDDDVVVGTSYAPNNKSIYYFINDGEGNFAEGSLQGINPAYAEVTPVFIDADGDGDKDLVLGEAGGSILYFKRTGTNSFEEQVGIQNPFDGINKGPHSSPSRADFDNDGDDDLIIGAENALSDIFYFENKGNSVFEEKIGFDNPFGGINVGMNASPLFTDLDQDGDTDLIIGSQSGSGNAPLYVENIDGTFVIEEQSNPFAGLDIPHSFFPAFIDLDADGDKDLAGSVGNTESTIIEYYKNDNGVFTQQPFASGPFKDITVENGKCDFADIDNDGDYDLFISETLWDNWQEFSYIRFYENTGTPQEPIFTAKTGAENPLAQVAEEFTLFPRFADIDHDGDLDALIGEGGTTIENQDGNEFLFYENTGTPTSPAFTYRGNLIPQGDNTFEPQPSFFDYDNDGDLDVFAGGASGTIDFFMNTNPAATVVLNPDAAIISTESSVLLDNELSVTDDDNDAIVNAFISIAGFISESESLSFTPQAGITGSFNETTGVLTLSGKASVTAYQSVLRTVSYAYINPSVSGRRRQEKQATLTKTISITMKDADGTNAAAAIKTINIVSGQAPVFADTMATIAANSILTIPLSTLITDTDNDADLVTLTILSPPSSGAHASIENAALIVDYTGIPFASDETITLSICDADNNCDQGTITIHVTNTAPVIQPTSITVVQYGNTVINLLQITSDTENNLDPSAFEISVAPVSGAPMFIEEVSATDVNLVIDYAAISFTGADHLTVRACDRAGACAESVLSILVEELPDETPDEYTGDIEVYNAIAPAGAADNRFMRIAHLPQINKVTIFNRWGDAVFAIDGYDDNIPGKRFEGIASNGKILPSGTYFYKVEYSNNEDVRKTITGYLSLKQ